MNYIYDGTFEGLLTCVYEHYYTEKATSIMSSHSQKNLQIEGEAVGYQEDMLNSLCIVDTDFGKYEKVYNAINDKISRPDLERIYRAFRSTVADKEMKILAYIRLGFKLQRKLRLLHTHEIVLAVEGAERKVGREVERLLGLVRFNEITADNGARTLYARVCPDHDVIEFLANHFADRYKHEQVVIHDERRDKALAISQGKWCVVPFTNDMIPTIDDDYFTNLWRHYFKTISIEERLNPKCQKNFMPARYWSNLPETQDAMQKV
ncbi:MAG: TIGR03915 family putative DNA repair protein [Clostridiales Family XIII bacterium]|nr:TIGR03915 family putative DNA repair protein [Clostridiales Family XIII bacterium]